MEFAGNLKILLNNRELKQADLCRVTGIQSSLISDYLSGKKSPALGNAVLIADALGVSLDALAGRRPLSPGEIQPDSVLPPLQKAVNELTEQQQLFVLDTIQALKKHLDQSK